jgi:hypothetical protein
MPYYFRLMLKKCPTLQCHLVRGPTSQLKKICRQKFEELSENNLEDGLTVDYKTGLLYERIIFGNLTAYTETEVKYMV